MRSLELLQAFTVGWHRRTRDLNELCRELRAELIVRPGGRKVLGFAVALEGVRQVVLNERLKGSPLRTPVMAHECAHLLGGVQGVGLCASVPHPGREERNAWGGAALLAVPIDARLGSATGRRQLATELDIPVELVELRATLTEYLARPSRTEEGTPPARPARLEVAHCLSHAFHRWYERFEAESAAL